MAGGAATAARAAFAALCLAACLSGSIAAAEDAPPEPGGYRLEAYRAPTPATLAGAKVLDTDAAAEIWRAGTAAFIDVLPRPPRPAGLPEGTVWRDAPHDSIPGAIWLPNVGFGALNADTEAYFRAGLEAASRGDVNAPLVIFCQRQCWMSWNAAKRVLEHGYRNVAWFPDGTDGWAQAGLPLTPATPRP
ncbi:PQQ-dependent catabolism-associated CXXCW motif protein [Xanthobacter oligotrophicus]|uniref:PQQ-dependent catabolism-associated CXXCW motif protein n=1 Tax=Xanthobacter oligotrophicus TaxID=2607286 RepID=UPI0011F1AD1C|nr:PQQ-dependent catabolism-associated CXXCW motif protein [Xanthobacter oligotrophicus]MCG5237714.1 PQQ-dependent catabolism-associated CXXCW motif protein [Xanthobacter oligotrophicus]